ncbi:MAG: hypothetical protein SFY80_14715 [Verrucomicrobiota bacterium]|nr:hypothetical protein [Verrucomicrobiota bacterium]
MNIRKTVFALAALACLTASVAVAADTKPSKASTPAASAAGAKASAKAAAPAAAEKQNVQLMRVSQLNSVEANQTFNQNMRLVQSQLQAISEMKARLEKETSASEKAKIQKEFDEALAKLNENNQKMWDTYRWSVNRQYLVVPEKSSLYMVLTPEEAAKVAAEQEKADAAKK